MKMTINMLKSGDGAAQITGSRYAAYSTISAGARERNHQSETASWAAGESRVRGIMWVLVVVTLFWDVAVTFGPHFEWARRFF
jgi:hypothetical protein